jgi:hypothetical protein
MAAKIATGEAQDTATGDPRAISAAEWADARAAQLAPPSCHQSKRAEIAKIAAQVRWKKSD